MKVQGNAYPEIVTVEHRIDMTGIVEIRIRENINDVSYIDQESGQNITMYEYDEYTTLSADRPSLKNEISENIQDWITTLRTMEVNQNASIVRNMQYDITTYETELAEIQKVAQEEQDKATSEMAALIEEVYNSDMEVIENV